MNQQMDKQPASQEQEPEVQPSPPVSGWEKIKALVKKYKKIISEVIKYNIAGLANTLIDWGAFALLNKVLGLHFWISKPVSYSLGIANSFLMNKFLTFKKEQQVFKGIELIKFILVNLISLGVSMILMQLLESYLGIEKVYGNMMVFPITYVINFFLYKFWIFKSKEL